GEAVLGAYQGGRMWKTNSELCFNLISKLAVEFHVLPFFFFFFFAELWCSLVPAGHSPSADVSPSPSAEPSGLLSLPWEILTHIASHLPAQCVINVLPKVCHALSKVGQDSTAWQLRARRLMGSRAAFPVGTLCTLNYQAGVHGVSAVHHIVRTFYDDVLTLLIWAPSCVVILPLISLIALSPPSS
uniref:F-box domain-containing protein n=1 Tax=Amphilophus citrinellus TaxID=61819 RepID=A0A3Q0RIA8_AMPCI